MIGERKKVTKSAISEAVVHTAWRLECVLLTTARSETLAAAAEPDALTVAALIRIWSSEGLARRKPQQRAK